AIIYLGTKGLLKNVPVNEVKDFEETFLTSLEKEYPDVLKTFKSGKLSEEATAAVEKLAKELTSRYQS
ncbi:MAG: F0F1 ATP synthase subunit alpha, partial [Bacteroidota bacterium]